MAAVNHERTGMFVLVWKKTITRKLTAIMREQRLCLDQPERLTFTSSRIVNANGEALFEVTFR